MQRSHTTEKCIQLSRNPPFGKQGPDRVQCYRGTMWSNSVAANPRLLSNNNVRQITFMCVLVLPALLLHNNSIKVMTRLIQKVKSFTTQRY